MWWYSKEFIDGEACCLQSTTNTKALNGLLIIVGNWVCLELFLCLKLGERSTPKAFGVF